MIPPFRCAPLLLLAGSMVLAPSLRAQTREVRLTAPSARLEHPLSSVSGFRELSDGRVIVSDGIDQTVLLVDLAKGRVDTVGRTGQGPGEYKTPDMLLPLPGGATLLVDLGNARLSVFAADGKYQESLPIAQGRPGAGGFGGLHIVIPRGTDARGRLYFQQVMGGPRADSAPVIRWDRAAGVFDTVAMVKLPSVVTRSSGSVNNRAVSQRPRPYPIQDTWAVAPDGRVAVVRAPEYRVDWIGAGTQPQRGKPVPFQPISIGKAEKEEWLNEQAATGLQVRAESRNGEVSMSFSRGSRGGDQPDREGYEWPETKPGFATGSAQVAPDGRLWVERSVASGRPRSYDVFGAEGEPVLRVTFPAGRRLVGVGMGVAYARQVDENGVNWLERYIVK